jgi:hypothetical protein
MLGGNDNEKRIYTKTPFLFLKRRKNGVFKTKN